METTDPAGMVVITLWAAMVVGTIKLAKGWLYRGQINELATSTQRPERPGELGV